MKFLLSFIYLMSFIHSSYAQIETKYPDIPRVDVHTHPANDYGALRNYLKLRDILKQEYKVDFAFWINLSNRKKPIHNLDSVLLVSEYRSLACIADYEAHKGLTYQPDDLIEKMNEGFVGYKIWYGTKSRRLEPNEKGYPYIDDPHNDLC